MTSYDPYNPHHLMEYDLIIVILQLIHHIQFTLKFHYNREICKLKTFQEVE